MPSTRHHSPGTTGVSSGGPPAAKSAGKPAPLSALIDESDRAVERLLADLDDPRRQAALSDLAAQSARAADALYGLEQIADGLHHPGESP